MGYKWVLLTLRDMAHSSALSTRDYIAIATAVPAFPFIALDLSPNTMKLACLSCKFSAHTGVCRISSEPFSSFRKESQSCYPNPALKNPRNGAWRKSSVVKSTGYSCRKLRVGS